FFSSRRRHTSSKRDWSSDVCSSDLLWRMRRELPRITFGNYVRAGETADIKTLAGRMASLLDPAMSWKDVEEVRRIWKGPMILKEIGRASCRERVSVSGGAGAVKTEE